MVCGVVCGRDLIQIDLVLLVLCFEPGVESNSGGARLDRSLTIHQLPCRLGILMQDCQGGGATVNGRW